MRGVILAGGLGTRLSPLTRVTNKHLLPVYDRPMIYYPIENLVRSGISQILLVTGGQFAGDFLNLLRNGKELGIQQLAYAYQEGEGGIADALKLAREFVKDQRFCVMLGDNLYGKLITKHVERFARLSPGDAMVLTQNVDGQNDPRRFGLAVRNRDERFDEEFWPRQIVEKPDGRYLRALNEQCLDIAIVTGTYFYTPEVFDVCEQLKPSARGELEISDVNQHYVAQKRLLASSITGWWSDAGTFMSLHTAEKRILESGVNCG